MAGNLWSARDRVLLNRSPGAGWRLLGFALLLVGVTGKVYPRALPIALRIVKTNSHGTSVR
jgi:hypothetical protein